MGRFRKAVSAGTLGWRVLTLTLLTVESGHSLPLQSEMQPSPAQSTEANRESARSDPSLPRISLGSQTGTPGTSIVIPLYYTPPEGGDLRSLAVEVEWVSKNLQFVRSERGISAESIGADVAGKVTGTQKDDKGIEHSTLRIDASVVEENPKRGIPEGLLAYLTFKISSEAQAFAIELRPKLLAATEIGPAGKKISQAEVENGRVGVELPGLPPYVTCFLFSH